MNHLPATVGVLDACFLSRSVGTLNPVEPLTLKYDEKVIDAIRLFQKNKVGCVVIVDDEEKIVGIFSERDVVLKLFNQETSLTSAEIADVMTSAPKTVSMTTPIAFALNLMSAGGYRHMPVVDDDNVPVGIISIKDIIDSIAESVTSALAAMPE